ncbi:porin family protein [Bergeyella sp. RCAD1439]|uniref:porin family protein n=1 Tax=Bergeyella anatis TaxID=3113737 RepID=UPI002E19EC67|nr:porin family protein [Bergeyella sp. RCAD1439]
MKKLVLGLALSASTALAAQIDFSSTRFGIIGGYNYSRVQNAHNPSGPRHTLQGGVTALIPIDNYDQFYIQPEVVYYGAGETGRDKRVKGRPGYDALYANNYISVPIYFKGYFSEAETEFFGLIGPRFGFLINQKVENPSRQAYTLEGDQYAKGKSKGFNLAIGGGIGFSYKRKLEISGRYDVGLSNTYPGLMTENGSDPNIQKKKSQQVASIVLNYIFD